jgi:tetratricopeptide (TPR) repeat protein
MAKLKIIENFKATCGTVSVYKHNFRVEIVFEGEIQGDFVSGLDYDLPKIGLKKIIKELNGRHLNEILGRATDENIAVYLLYKLRSFPIASLVLCEDDKNCVEITPCDCDYTNYEALLALNKGKYFLVSGKYHDGIRELSLAISVKSDSCEAYNFRGRCYKYLSQYEKALEDFSYAIKLNPNYGEAHRNRGNVYYYLDKDDLMLSDFDTAVKLLPTSALAYNNRGFALQKLNKYKEAIADHTRAIQLDDQYAEAYKDRGDAHVALNEPVKARADYRMAEKLEKEQKGKSHEISKVYF